MQGEVEELAVYLSTAHGIPKRNIIAKPPNKKKGGGGGKKWSSGKMKQKWQDEREVARSERLARRRHIDTCSGIDT